MSSGADVSRIAQSIIKGPLASLCESQPPRHKADFQVDKNLSLKAGGELCSGLSWGSLEAVLLGEGINDS